MLLIDEPTVAFTGSADEQAFAAQVFGLLVTRGRFMAIDAPIKVSVSSLVAYFEQEGVDEAENRLQAMVAANPSVFAIEELDGKRLLVTRRSGAATVPTQIGSTHTFATRFLTPQPKPERPVQPVRVRPRVDPSWASLPAVLDGFDEDSEFETEVEPGGDGAVAADLVAAELDAVDTTVAIDAEVEGDAAEVVEAPTPPARTITLPVAAPTDVAGVDDIDLADAIRQRLQSDPRVANFGEQWMMEDRVPRFSRGDLRRMKEYLQEKEQPSTDDDLAQDVLNARPGSPEFDLVRFAVNYRLSREHREFEFVGTTNQRFWTTGGVAQIGTTRRKPNEIGSDFRYLLDEAPETPAYRSVDSIDHTLSFYEYVHGLLPYDAGLQALLPGPVLSNQRSAVFTFETPQSYTTYLVELRYPTPNRGGFVLGLDDFFTENLVPGAVLSVSRTDNDGHYRVEYVAEPGQSSRLLELDERRALRFVFRPTTFGCGVDPALLLTEERFGRLANEKPLDEKARRRPETVVAATFERVGDDREGNFSAEFTTLLAGVNIERPMSERLLRSVLENDDSGAFSRDPEGPDVYTYVPGSTP